MQMIAERLPLVFSIWVFCLGAVVGSFLNVVIARVPAGESIVSPGSRCPRCKSEIRWYDNIPLFSWIILRARCRKCGLPISIRYPVVELITAVLFASVVRLYGPTWASVGYCAMVAALVSLAYIDLDTWLLPHQITWPLLGVGLLSWAWNTNLTWTESLIGAGVGFALFAAIALFGEKVLKRETMGWGDVWLLAGLGAWLGWPALLPVIMLSALQGSIVGVILIAAGKGEKGAPPAEAQAPAPAEPTPAAPASTEPAAQPEGAPVPEEEWVPPKHAVPYGPFLALAAIQYLLVGSVMIDLWYGLVGRLIR
jgi:leader peptidase (prepilin peptidase)/N-methyltransferase